MENDGSVWGSRGEKQKGGLLIRINESVEILATPSDLVPTGSEEVDWQQAMKRAIRTSDELRRRLRLPRSPQVAAEASFPTFVPLEFLRRIRVGDPDDPLLRQVLPIVGEDLKQQGFLADPVADLSSQVAGGLLHKYHARALMISTGACGIHCRYCFRREFPYSSAGLQAENDRPALDYLRQSPEIEEVLLSGGDPLTLVDTKLGELIDQIEAIEHVRRLRIHSRMPIVIPQRVTDVLVDRLRRSRLAVWFVVHANHPNELDSVVMERLARLVDAGIPVLNQAVLLRGVNDDVEVLRELCTKLIDHRVSTLR